MLLKGAESLGPRERFEVEPIFATVAVCYYAVWLGCGVGDAARAWPAREPMCGGGDGDGSMVRRASLAAGLFGLLSGERRRMALFSPSLLAHFACVGAIRQVTGAR